MTYSRRGTEALKPLLGLQVVADRVRIRGRDWSANEDHLVDDGIPLARGASGTCGTVQAVTQGAALLDELPSGALRQGDDGCGRRYIVGNAKMTREVGHDDIHFRGLNLRATQDHLVDVMPPSI